MTAPIVFLDIAGPDAGVLQAFYSALFGWDASAPQFSIPVMTPFSVAIREDPAEKRCYVGVDDVTATLEAIEALGGSIDQPRFEVPGVVILGLFRDPAGNPMGLVEMEDGEHKVP
jgi:predicted enzyme related to lactoylglutathione lyase